MGHGVSRYHWVLGLLRPYPVRFTYLIKLVLETLEQIDQGTWERVNSNTNEASRLVGGEGRRKGRGERTMYF